MQIENRHVAEVLRFKMEKTAQNKSSSLKHCNITGAFINSVGYIRRQIGMYKNTNTDLILKKFGKHFASLF